MLSVGSNLGAIRAKFEARVARAKNPQPAVTAVGAYLASEGRRRINVQGDPSWIPNKKGTHTGIDTGTMLGAINFNLLSANSVQIGVGAIAPYARYFQEGTGVYVGKSAWTVKPKSANALAFSTPAGQFVRKSVTIPGQPPRPFIYADAKNLAFAKAIVLNFIQFGTLNGKAA
jgi:hypothetical protein